MFTVSATWYLVLDKKVHPFTTLICPENVLAVLKGTTSSCTAVGCFVMFTIYLRPYSSTQYSYLLPISPYLFTTGIPGSSVCIGMSAIANTW